MGVYCATRIRTCAFFFLRLTRGADAPAWFAYARPSNAALPRVNLANFSSLGSYGRMTAAFGAFGGASAMTGWRVSKV